MKNWSFSKLSTFEECPKKFRFIYIDKLQGQIKSDAMAIGEGLHDFIEFYSLNQAASLEDCQEKYLKTALGASCLVNPKKAENMLSLVKWYKESGKVLTPLRTPNEDKPLTEKWFKLDCGNNIFCNGKIDIVTENHCVVDYKTASKPYTQKDAEHVLMDKGLQLTVYAAAYHQWFNKMPKKVGFQVILKDKSEIQNIGSSRTEKDVENVKKYVVRENDRFNHMSELGMFPKGLNPKCFWCNFREECNNEV
jgi:putative RecB family exonuclease